MLVSGKRLSLEIIWKFLFAMLRSICRTATVLTITFYTRNRVRQSPGCRAIRSNATIIISIIKTGHINNTLRK